MKIVVLCGGTSTERDVSIVSGTGVCKALRQKGHAAILLDVFFGYEEAVLMDAFPEDYDVEAAALYIRSCGPRLKSALENTRRSFFGPNVLKLCLMADIVFLALHGSNGEDGRLQAAFDLMKIRYTGSGYVGSALAMDKALTKKVLATEGIPVPMGTTLRRGCDSIRIEDVGLHFPVVVKVACGGSSVGVYIVHDEEEYERALDEAFELEGEVLIEEYIKGREFSVGVIDGKALPIIEIAPKKGFYDYKNKYTPGATVDTCPADLTAGITQKMQRYAEESYHALGLSAYARVDFMMNAYGQMYVLEANTLPGMTPTSLMPQEAEEDGLSYADFCQKLLEVSLAKYR